MCTCAVVGNGAIIEAPATGVERACDRLSVAPLLRATALAVPGTLVTGMMPCRCVCLRRRVAPGLPMNPRPGPARARVQGRRPAPSPRVPRSRAASYLWPVRPYAVPRRTRRRGDAVRGAAGSTAWGRRRAGTACACCARYSTSWSPGVEQFLLVDDVVAVEDGAALVPGQEALSS